MICAFMHFLLLFYSRYVAIW